MVVDGTILRPIVVGDRGARVDSAEGWPAVGLGRWWVRIVAAPEIVGPVVLALGLIELVLVCEPIGRLPAGLESLLERRPADGRGRVAR